MATSKKVTGELRKQIEEEDAGNKEYLRQKQRNLANFKKHIEEVEDCKEPLEEVVKNLEVLESYVKNYFFGIEVAEVVKDAKTGKLNKTGLMVPPKMGYAKNIKASLFGVFTKEYQVRNMGCFQIKVVN